MKGILVPSLEHLRTNGAFGFPQSKAKTLCDLPELRFSVTSNDKYLLAQAILWKDGNAALGKTDDGRAIGDHSELLLELGTDGVVTPKVDRTYSLNPWPHMPGLHYHVSISQDGWTGLQRDSRGRGAIRWVSFPNGMHVRVDTYAVPLTEISKQTGESIRLCYYGDSPAPKFTVDSTHFFGKRKNYYSGSIPRSAYHEYVLEKGLVPDISKFPEGRITGNKVAPTPNPKLSVKVGDTVDMEFTAMDGRAISLSKLKGKVVLVDFWATWCGPCMAELPKVLAAYLKLHDQGFEIIGISFDEDKATLERVLKQKGMTWPQYFDGKLWGNEFGVKYGIDAIPSMWLIDRDGKVASTNARQDLVQQVEQLINSKPE
jgi:thiol-disulfide isomerase/thioredoxin